MARERKPDELWISVDQYANSCLQRKPESFDQALNICLETSRANGLPNISVSPAQGKFLMLQCRLLQAERVLEIGTLGGYSALWLAAASPKVQVTTIEANEKHAKIARANFQASGLGHQIKMIVGNAREILTKMKKDFKTAGTRRFDIVFIDADKENNWTYVDLVLHMVRPRACIIVDNVARNGALANQESSEDPKINGCREVVQRVGSDDRIDGVVMQTVGEKGYDGFLMAIVNADIETY